MPEAARHLDEISHSHAELGFMVGTLAAGVLGGLASYGLGVALAGLACAFPFGTIAAIAIGLAVGAMVIGPAGDFLQSAGEAIGSTFTYVTGVLTAIGSANVLINNRAAFRADARLIDYADCSKHPSYLHSPVIEGATTVWTNAMRAARKGDAVDCDAKISSGSANVLIGSPPYPVASKRSNEISDDLRKHAGWFRMGAEILGGAAVGVGKSLPCFLANVAVGVGIAVGANASGLELPIPSFDYGKTGGKAAGTWLGNAMQGRPVHVPTGAKIVPFENDAALPGPLPFVWSRFYSSKDGRTGILGQGWVTPASLELVFKEGLLHFIGFQGRDLAYDDLAPGEKRYILDEQFQIARSLSGYYYVSYPSDGLIYAFGPRHTLLDGERMAVRQCDDLHGNTHEYLYDDAGLLRTISTSAGQHLHLHYGNPNGVGTRLTRIDQQLDQSEASGSSKPSHLTVPAPTTVVSYRYDAEGNLSEVIDRQGQSRRGFAYQNHIMVVQRFASGLLCYYEWDQTTPDGKVLRHRIEDLQVPNGGLEAYAFSYGEPDETGHYEVHCTDHLGRQEHWQCNAHFLVTRYTNPLGQTSEIDWNRYNRMTRHSLPGGGDWRFTYDTRGQLATVYDPLGRSATLRWEDRWGKLAQLVDWDGRSWQCTYNDTGDCTETTGPAGWSQSTVYNDTGLPVLSTDAQGGIKRLRWSERAELIEYTDCSGQSTRYTWDRWGHLQTVTDALGHTTAYTHDPIGQLLAVRTADGASQGYQYDAAGRLIGASDPLSRAARFAYNARNQLSTRRDAEDRPISLTYDAAHRLSALINENGETFHFQYDAADRLTQETRVGGTKVEVEYDTNGWPTAVTHHPGIGDEPQLTPGQSPAGQTPQIANWGDATRAGPAADVAQPQRTELIRDAAGRLIEKRTPTHHYHYRYDALDRLLEAQKLQVQADGSLKPRHTTRFAYDVLGNLVEETATDEATGQAHTLRHAHDALGNRLQTTLPALAGRQSTERALNYLHYGSGHLHQINYSQRSIQGDKQSQDGEGAKATHQATHQLICDIERDALHQEVLRTQGKTTTRYALDPLGRRTGAWSRSNSLVSAPFSANDTEWQRAILSAGTSEARPLNGLMKAYAYDKAGELRQTRHSLQGDAAHRYDATGRVEETRRSPFAQATQGTTGTTAPSERFQYDPAGNILDNASAQALAQRTQHLQAGYVRDNLVRVYEDKRYAYDGHGRLIQKLSGKHTAQTFTWDEENRLTEVRTIRRPGTEHETRQTTRFDYDAIGRRVAKHDRFGTTVFIWEGMRLIEERRNSQVISYVYEPGSYVPLARLDANGEQTEQGGLGTTDDAELDNGNTSKTIAASARESSAGGLKGSPSQPAANDAEAQYWAALETTAQRHAKATGTYASANASGNTTAKRCEVYYFHTDQVGMPEELTNADGQLCWQATYKTWGSTVSESWEVKELAGRKVHPLDEGDKLQGEAQQQNLRFQGQYLDRETGLHYNTFRFYDADIGRFISPDPIGLRGGINLGSYSPNPISWIDPWGWACASANDTVTRGANGEVLSVRGTISPADIGTGTTTNASSRAAARALGNATDDAGHMRGNNLGGSGGKSNTFPQDPHVNRGDFQVFEGRVADHVQATGKPVDFEQIHNHGNGGTRPTSIDYKIIDPESGAVIMQQNFPN